MNLEGKDKAPETANRQQNTNLFVVVFISGGGVAAAALGTPAGPPIHDIIHYTLDFAKIEPQGTKQNQTNRTSLQRRRHKAEDDQ